MRGRRKLPGRWSRYVFVASSPGFFCKAEMARRSDAVRRGGLPRGSAYQGIAERAFSNCSRAAEQTTGPSEAAASCSGGKGEGFPSHPLSCRDAF